MYPEISDMYPECILACGEYAVCLLKKKFHERLIIQITT